MAHGEVGGHRAARAGVMGPVRAHLGCLALLGLIGLMPAPAASQQVRITKLTDQAFGSITNLAVDAVRSENVCVFSNTATRGYNVKATGAGAGGAFTLNLGSSALAYEVQWNGASGQSSGTSLSPGATLTGLTSTATQQACSNGPATTASLIVIIRTAVLTAAIAGVGYSGTLTIVIGPE
jgi:hypothetical protein